MKVKVKHMVITSIGSALGICLLIMLLRAWPTQAGATEVEDLALARKTAALGVTDWQTIALDAYDGTFTTTYSVQREITHTGTAGYAWGRVLTSAADFTNTLWCVGSAQIMGLDPDTDTYTDGVTTTVTYGPMDWHDVVTAEVSFSHWISLASGDGVEWGTSTDGSAFSYSSIASAAGAWAIETIHSDTDAGLASLLRERTAYLSFRFHSDGDGRVDRGAFLDNVQVRVRRDTTTYLPQVSREFYDFNGYTDSFDSSLSGWPQWHKYTLNSEVKGWSDWLTWGDYTLDTVAEDHYGGYKTDADTSKVYYVGITDDGDEVFLTGPVQTPRDFVYEVWERWSKTTDRWANEVGILLSERPINPADAHSFDAYVFAVQINNGTNVPHKTVVKHWVRNNWNNNVTKALDWGYLNPGVFTHAAKEWNMFRVERKGTTYTFKLARPGAGWTTVGSFSDPTFERYAYIGFFAAHERTYSYPLEWQFDNVSLQLNP